MRAATGADVKSVFVGAGWCWGCFYSTSDMIAARFIRGALVTTNGVLEIFETSCLRKLSRDFGFIFIFHHSKGERPIMMKWF